MSALVTLVACLIVFTTCSRAGASKQATFGSPSSSYLSQLCNASFAECCQQFELDLRYNTRFPDTSWYHRDGECCILARFSYCINVKYARRAVFSSSLAQTEVGKSSQADKCRDVTKKFYKLVECDDHSVTYPSLYCSAFFNSHIIALCLLILVLTTCFYCCAKVCTGHRERNTRSSQYVLLKVPVANVDRYVTLNQGSSHDRHSCCQVCPKQLKNKQSKPSCPSEDLMPYSSQPLVNTNNLPNYYTGNHPGAF